MRRFFLVFGFLSLSLFAQAPQAAKMGPIHGRYGTVMLIGKHDTLLVVLLHSLKGPLPEKPNQIASLLLPAKKTATLNGQPVAIDGFTVVKPPACKLAADPSLQGT
jgi:hypothetical protein